MKFKRQKFETSRIPKACYTDYENDTPVKAIIKAGRFDVGMAGALKPIKGKAYFTKGFAERSSKEIERIVLQDNIFYIEDKAFANSKIITMDMSRSSYMVQIGKECFEGSSSLVGLILPRRLREIPLCFCYGCRNLKRIVIPNSVRSIDRSAFNSCTSLSEVVLGDEVAIIESYAFYNTAIEGLTFPKSLEKLDLTALKRCEHLKFLHFIGFNPKTVIDIDDCKQGDFNFNSQTWLELLKRNPKIISLMPDKMLFDEEYVSLCKIAIIEGMELRDKELGLDKERSDENIVCLNYVTEHLDGVKAKHPDVLNAEQTAAKAEFMAREKTEKSTEKAKDKA